jgi:5'-methylthioadenosine phosphorylase
MHLHSPVPTSNHRRLHGGTPPEDDIRSMALQAKIGIIGGSGLYSMPGFEVTEEVVIETPFGSPSDPFVVGTLEGKPVAFLARHGRGHRILPTELNYRANIYGMKKLGVEYIFSLSAVGSLQEQHKPLEFFIPDQFVDRALKRQNTFFGEGLVAHVSFADPISPELAEIALAACEQAGVTAKRGGTYLCMEGPGFSSRAESNLYRSWGMDVIGMTNATEAKLAREAEIAYVTIAMVTDYDCWHEAHDAVTVEEIIHNLHQNAENAAKVVRAAVRLLPNELPCAAHHALRHALITDKSVVPEVTKQKLWPIIGRYFA